MSLPVSILRDPVAHAQASATARAHCLGCVHNRSMGPSSVFCAARAEKLAVRHVGDVCPLPAPLFDHRIVIPVPATWAEWYARANAYEGDATSELEWIAGFIARLVGCSNCRTHAEAMLAATPPDLTNADAYFASIAGYHNQVNDVLNRPQWSLEDAIARWRS